MATTGASAHGKVVVVVVRVRLSPIDPVYPDPQLNVRVSVAVTTLVTGFGGVGGGPSQHVVDTNTGDPGTSFITPYRGGSSASAPRSADTAIGIRKVSVPVIVLLNGGPCVHEHGCV